MNDECRTTKLGRKKKRRKGEKKNRGKGQKKKRRKEEKGNIRKKGNIEKSRMLPTLGMGI